MRLSREKKSKHLFRHAKISCRLRYIAKGNILIAGTVLGKVTASGEYKQLDPNKTDGTETAAAVLYTNVTTTDAKTKAVLIARDAEVAKAALVWPSGISSNNKDAALGALKEQGIVAR